MPGQELGKTGVVGPIWTDVDTLLVHVGRNEPDVVPIAGFDKELAIAITEGRDLRVPRGGIEEDAVRLGFQSRQGFKEHNGIAEVCARRSILAVRIARPVDRGESEGCGIRDGVM